MTMQRLRTIFASFFKIGLFTFGGGYAMLPLIEQELIAKRGWIEHKEFLDLLTLAQSVPGPIAINTSVCSPTSATIRSWTQPSRACARLSLR